MVFFSCLCVCQQNVWPVWENELSYGFAWIPVSLLEITWMRFIWTWFSLILNTSISWFLYLFIHLFIYSFTILIQVERRERFYGGSGRYHHANFGTSRRRRLRRFRPRWLTVLDAILQSSCYVSHRPSNKWLIDCLNFVLFLSPYLVTHVSVVDRGSSLNHGRSSFVASFSWPRARKCVM